MSNVKHKTTRGGSLLTQPTSTPCSFSLGEIRLKSLQGRRILEEFRGRFKPISTVACQASTPSVTPSSGVCSYSQVTGKGKNHRQHLVSTTLECPRLRSQCLAQTTETVRAKTKTQIMRITDYHFRSFLPLCFSEGGVSMPSTGASVTVVKVHSQHSPVFS